MDGHSNNPCEGCGICCAAFPIPPFDSNELVKAPDSLMEEIEAYAGGPGYTGEGPCIWQDPGTGKCTHYDVRPVLCRWLEPGGGACNDLREKSGLPRV